MKILRSLVALAAVLSVSAFALGTAARAQDPAGAPPAGGKQAKRGGAANGNPLNVALKALTLTADQQTKVDDLMKAYREAVKADNTGGTPASPEQRQAREEKLTADIKAVLTDAQKTQFDAELTKVRAERAAGPFVKAMEGLDLTDEQKAKVTPIVQDTAAQITKIRADDGLKNKERRTKMAAVVEEMKGKVRPLLTPEQQTKFDAIQWPLRGARGGNGGRGGNGAPAPAPAP
jgi:Spy/CpxP family protein refolding chaperone